MNTFHHSIADGNKPYWTWGPLIFTGFYFLPSITNPSALTAFNIVGLLGLFCLFLLMYAKAVYTKGNDVIPLLVLMTIVTGLGTYITPGTQTLFGYIAFIAGFNLSIKKSTLTVIFLWSVIVTSGYIFAHASIYFFIPSLLISLGLFIFGMAAQRDAKHVMQQSQSQEKIEQLAAIAERERIARDIHDVIGHSLSSIALKSELAEKLIALNEHAKAAIEIKAVATISREILSEVREAVSGLKHLNLLSKITDLSAELSTQGFSVKKQSSVKQLDSIIESTLVLILTEAVTNIMRHSKGNQVDITLYDEAQHTHLIIKDNGDQTAYTRGNGLLGIYERCEQLNGECIIKNTQGFSMHIALPNIKPLAT